MTTPMVLRRRSKSCRGRRPSAGAAVCPDGLDGGTGSPGSNRPDPQPGHHEDPAARTRAPRTHGRLALHLLPWRGPANGRGPRAIDPQRHFRPGVRRRAPHELWTVRVAGKGPPFRHQRLRRDARRCLGVGLDAPVGEPGGGRRAPRSSALTRLAMPCSRLYARIASEWPSTPPCAPSTSTTRVSTVAPSWSSRTSVPGRTSSRRSIRRRTTTRCTSCRTGISRCRLRIGSACRHRLCRSQSQCMSDFGDRHLGRAIEFRVRLSTQCGRRKIDQR